MSGIAKNGGKHLKHGEGKSNRCGTQQNTAKCTKLESHKEKYWMNTVPYCNVLRRKILKTKQDVSQELLTSIKEKEINKRQLERQKCFNGTYY